jgi:hypothetical protein
LASARGVPIFDAAHETLCTISEWHLGGTV